MLTDETLDHLMTPAGDGPSAVVALLCAEIRTLRQALAASQAQVAAQATRIANLERRLAQDSHNSSWPPSHDGPQTTPRRRRPRSDTPVGGQPGHAGHTLRRRETPDQVITCTPDHCWRCGGDLADAPVVGQEERQTIDAPPLRAKGHRRAVNGVVFSPDGTRLASASDDGTVNVWYAAKGQSVLTLLGHTGHVNSVAFSPDGKRLASASNDRTVRLWDAVTGREILTLRGYRFQILSVAFSPDGKRLASGDDPVQVWDTATGQEVLTLKGQRGVRWSVAFSPDGTVWPLPAQTRR